MSDLIVTTHVGSLPRPAPLVEALLADRGRVEAENPRLKKLVAAAVLDVVRLQSDIGIDVVNDGEMGRTSYTHYVKDRLAGLTVGDASEGAPANRPPRDMADHPDVASGQAGGRGTARGLLAPILCEGPITYDNRTPLDQDIENLGRALNGRSAQPFLSAASPGTLAHFIRNRHYSNEDEYIASLADAMRIEYEAIYKSGIVLQIDCPDLAMSRHMSHQSLSDDEFIKIAERNVEALNHATRSIPPNAMRMHICWGNYPGPHTHDIPVSRILATVLRARPAAILFEGANPRHEHEWEDWKAAKIPDEKILIPGVIDTTTNLVEHPRLVAQRLRRYGEIVGRDRVIAGTDCGFGTVAGRDVVAPSVVWAKLASLKQGAELASSS